MAGLDPRLSGSVLDALHTSPLQSDCPQKSSCAGLTRASTGPFSRLHDVDGRDKHGHDDSKGCALSSGTTGFAQPDSRGLEPGIHADGRVKPGHDDEGTYRRIVSPGPTGTVENRLSH